jgi:hypothetical protein
MSRQSYFTRIQRALTMVYGVTDRVALGKFKVYDNITFVANKANGNLLVVESLLHHRVLPVQCHLAAQHAPYQAFLCNAQGVQRGKI